MKIKVLEIIPPGELEQGARYYVQMTDCQLIMTAEVGTIINVKEMTVREFMDIPATQSSAAFFDRK